MIKQLKTAAFALPVLLLLTQSCGSPMPHPNQLNAFDGATYDTLTVTHGALSYLRIQIVTSYPKYAPVMNQAITAYATAFDAYSLYRATPGSSSNISAAIGSLTISIVALEDTFLHDVQVPVATSAEIRGKADALRSQAGSASISDILTELQIAAALARTIPAAQPYAALAEIIIGATSQALLDQASASGQPIDLNTIQPIAIID